MTAGTSPPAAIRHPDLRVHLRAPVPDDLPAFTALILASESFLAPFEPLIEPGGAAGAETRFDRLVASNATGQDEKRLVVRTADDALLGCMNLNNIVRGVFLSASLGYWIGAPHVRQGYMGEALRLVLGHAFETLGLHRVEANLLVRNEASRALVRRAGFRKEGLSPRYLKIAGRWQDHERWALLVDEWRRVP